MNSSVRNVHSIPGIKNILIDGFRHRMPLITNPNERYFILTHFHSDHYTGLSSKWNFGRILCSPVTASLIITQLGIHPKWIQAIDIDTSMVIKTVVDVDENSIPRYGEAKLTFLDANHCPGAVIVVVELLDDNDTIHIHTGDMRYHPKMKNFRYLKEIICRKVDKLYLDTTYAHPKHNFMSQEESIATVIESSETFIKNLSVNDRNNNNWIIFISTYTIGKEKIFDALSDRLNVPIYMDDEKLNIVRLLGPSYKQRIANGIYTNNKKLGRIHVCSMGFAGSIWGYFRAHFDKIQRYLDDYDDIPIDSVNHSSCKVLAFIPTGWAESSNYNKNHPVLSRDNITVQIVPYSEHSQCQELIEFVTFIHPREIIPTVYSDEENKMFILNLFKNHVNSKDRIQQFIGRLPRRSQSSKESLTLYSETTQKGVADDSTTMMNMKSMSSSALVPVIDLTQEEHIVAFKSEDCSTALNYDDPQCEWTCNHCTYKHSNEEIYYLNCSFCHNPRNLGVIDQISDICTVNVESHNMTRINSKKRSSTSLPSATPTKTKTKKPFTDSIGKSSNGSRSLLHWFVSSKPST